MSELTSCCHCSLKGIESRAKARGLVITKLPSKFMGGTDVFVHPPNIVITELEGWNVPDHPIREKYFSAWMMQITEFCVC